MKGSETSRRSYRMWQLIQEVQLRGLHSSALCVLCLGISLLITSCASVSLDYPKTVSRTFEDTSQTKPALRATEWLDGRTDVNGFYPLTKGLDAFGARLKLMDAAEASIDVQYFLMKPDEAGLVFAAELMKAADRGVRVRFLLDDIFTTVDDIGLATLDEHPNIELRIFNPISRKGIYVFNYLGYFSLLNRRMHNKAFIVDNQLAVVGGRNIANEYYQLETTGEFIDFDMLAAGPIVEDVSTEFDTYWNHKLAIPLEALVKVKNPEQLARKRRLLEQKMAEAGDSIYGSAIDTPLMKKFFARTIDPYVADALLLTDDPDKLLEQVSDETQIVVNEMREAFADAEKEIIIITPYFIPRKRGIEFTRELTAKGIRIILLTNSLATNNHTSVHSAYSSYRKDLLRAGVELWEARADAAKFTTEKGETQLEHLTLHTKGALIDRKRIFVGSLNLDPRSIDINTEMGLLIDSPELGARLTENAFLGISDIGYRLQLGEDNKITWHATIDGQEVVETREPQTSMWKRFTAWFLKIAPESQL
ncbi:MAG: phospholipase D family protein [Desulfobulbales bacterium]